MIFSPCSYHNKRHYKLNLFFNILLQNEIISNQSPLHRNPSHQRQNHHRNHRNLLHLPLFLVLSKAVIHHCPTLFQVFNLLQAKPAKSQVVMLSPPQCSLTPTVIQEPSIESTHLVGPTISIPATDLGISVLLLPFNPISSDLFAHQYIPSHVAIKAALEK